MSLVNVVGVRLGEAWTAFGLLLFMPNLQVPLQLRKLLTFSVENLPGQRGHSEPLDDRESSWELGTKPIVTHHVELLRRTSKLLMSKWLQVYLPM